MNRKLKELCDHAWDIGIVSGVMAGVELIPLLQNEKEAIASARKAIQRIEDRSLEQMKSLLQEEQNARDQPRVITLTEEVRQEVPLAYMVFCRTDIDYDYMVFPSEREAHDYAMEQEERAGMPEGSWPMYALWATKWPNDQAQRLARMTPGTEQKGKL